MLARFTALCLAVMFLIAIAFAIIGCVPRAIPVNVPTPPKAAAKVAPAVERTRKASVASDLAAAKVEARIAVIHGQASHLAAGASGAVTEAARLAAQGWAGPEELAALHHRIVELTAEADRLRAEVEKAAAEAEAQKRARGLVGDELTRLTPLAYDKDHESDALRGQNADLGKSVTEQGKVIAKTQDDAVVGKLLRRGVIGIIIFLAIGGILWGVVKAAKPL